MYTLQVTSSNDKMTFNSCIVDRYRIEGQNMWEHWLTDANAIEEIQKNILDSLEDRNDLKLYDREDISKRCTSFALSKAKEMPSIDNSDYKDTREDLIQWCKSVAEKRANIWRTWLTDAVVYDEILNLVRQHVHNQLADRDDVLQLCTVFALSQARKKPPIDDLEYSDTREDLIQWCKSFAENRANIWKEWESWLTDASVFEEILNLVYLHVRNKFGDRIGLAEDCAIFALEQAWMKPPIDSPKFSDSKKVLIRWCKGVATNKAIDESRRKRADYFEEGVDPPDNNDQVDPTVIKEMKQIIEDSIVYIETRYPGNHYKQVFEWWMNEGLTDSQIAERLGWGNTQAATRRANRIRRDANRLLRAQLFGLQVDVDTAEIIDQGIDNADQVCDGCGCNKVLSLYYYTMSDRRTVFDELLTKTERNEGYHRFNNRFTRCQTLFWQYLSDNGVDPVYWR